MKYLIINGPNLNMLGIREPEIYGTGTLAELETMIRDHCGKMGIETEFFQSNIEGELVNAVQRAYFEKFDGIILNPAAYTHTSIALLDAVRSTGVPTVEVHLSDVDKRELYRQISYVSEAAIGTVKGKGFAGYLEAADMLTGHLQKEKA